MNSQDISRTRLEKLLSFCRQLSWTDAKEGFYESIASSLLEITECDTVVLRLFSEVSESMVICAIATEDTEMDPRGFQVMPLTVGRMPNLMQTLNPIFVDFDHPHESDVQYEYARELGYKYAITVPLVSRRTIIGVVDLSYKKKVVIDEDYQLWIDAIGSLLGVVMDNAVTVGKSIELKVLEERRILCSEVHENLAQSINTAKVEVSRAAETLAEGCTEMAEHQMYRAELACSEAYDYIRSEMRSLRVPENVEGSADIRDVIDINARQFEQQWGIPVKCEYTGVNDICPLPLRLTLQLERILHEALANVIRHASASEIIVGLNVSELGITLRIEDDGCGFDMETIPDDRMGLKIMSERSDGIGASLKVSSKVGVGTVVAVELPESCLTDGSDASFIWVDG